MRKLLALMIVSTALTGCLGFGKKTSPDEMAVFDNVALTLPPNFELRPPREGQLPQVEKGNAKAEALILGKNQGAVENLKPQVQPAIETPARESWLLEQAGGETRNKSIREIMAQEARAPEAAKKEKGWFEGMFSDEDDDPTHEELKELQKK